MTFVSFCGRCWDPKVFVLTVCLHLMCPPTCLPVESRVVELWLRRTLCIPRLYEDACNVFKCHPLSHTHTHTPTPTLPDPCSAQLFKGIDRMPFDILSTIYKFRKILCKNVSKYLKEAAFVIKASRKSNKPITWYVYSVHFKQHYLSQVLYCSVL